MKKRIISLIIIFAILAGFCITVNSKTEYNLDSLENCRKFYTSSNQKGAFIYGFKDSYLYVNSFTPQLISKTLKVDGIIRSVCQDNNITYVLYESFNTDDYYIYSFDISTETSEIYDFSFLDSVDTKCFTVCNNSVYFRKVDNLYAYVEVYSLKGDIIRQYNFDKVVTNVFNNNSKVYAVLQNGQIFTLAKNANNYVTEILSNGSLSDAGINYIFSNNNLISLKTGATEYIGKSSLSCVVKLQNNIVCSNNNVLYLKNDKTKLYTTDRKIIAVICFNDYVIILKDNYFSEIIKISDFKEPYNHSNQTDILPKTNLFVNDDNIICAVNNGITVSEFKNLFNYSVKVYNNNNVEITNGKMKTGYQSDCFGDLKYISVLGDITGEGNVKSNDVSLFMKYITDAKTLDIVNLTSCDYNLDSKIDNRDLVLISRKTKE